MSMRDLIPWRRQENPAPALFRDEERSPYVQLRREMDRLFEDFFRAPLVGGIGLSSNVQSWPYLEVKETDDQVIVTAELPGLTEKDVDVTVDDGVLTHPGYFFDFPRESFLIVSLLPSEAVFAEGVSRVLRHFDCNAGTQ